MGSQLGQVKSVDIKISFGGWPYFGLHTHMQDRLDKSRSALADARLKHYLAATTLRTVKMRSCPRKVTVGSSEVHKGLRRTNLEKNSRPLKQLTK